MDRKQQMKEFEELLKFVTFDEEEEVSRRVKELPRELPDSKTKEKKTSAKKNKASKRKISYYTSTRKKAARGNSEETQSDIVDKVVPNPCVREVRKMKSIPRRTEEYKKEDKSKGDTHLQNTLPNEQTDSMKYYAGIYPSNISAPSRRVIVNLRNLRIKPQLSPQKEKLMYDLRILLCNNGFEVHDRATLAYFALGNQNDTKAALSYFLEFYKFACLSEVKYPNRAEMGCGMIEGVACQPDGSLGVYFNAANSVPNITRSVYIVREILFYFLNFVNMSILNTGFTIIGNLRGLTWRKFMPFESATAANYLVKCIPLEPRRVIFLEPNFYASVAIKLLLKMIPNTLMMVASMTSLEKSNLDIIPPSLTAETKDNPKFNRFSIDQQLDFRLLLDV